MNEKNRWMQRTSIQSLYEHLVPYQPAWGSWKTVETVGEREEKSTTVLSSKDTQCATLATRRRRKKKAGKEKEVLISFRLLLKMLQKAHWRSTRQLCV